MAFQINDMSGFLFRNEDHEGNRPTHKGSIVINGVEYWMSAWTKEGKKGKFFSFSFEEKDAKYQTQRSVGHQNSQSPRQPSAGAGVDDFDDDIPF